MTVGECAMQSFATAFRMWMIEAQLFDTDGELFVMERGLLMVVDFCLFCKVEMHASKGAVQYRYKTVTNDSDGDFTWNKEPFEL